ncbi:hypothetical protein F4861DRAFT_513497 [Xylaria intraflava]|nr:hypothetical protein F4861DRAFT_513497 [Xylaria intraflava]
MPVCNTPLRADLLNVQTTALSALASCTVLSALNQGLVNKEKANQTKRTKRRHGMARVLTVEEIETEKQERDAEQIIEDAKKARKKALYGKVGFAKLVWKEMPMSAEIFL